MQSLNVPPDSFMLMQVDVGDAPVSRTDSNITKLDVRL